MVLFKFLIYDVLFSLFFCIQLMCRDLIRTSSRTRKREREAKKRRRRMKKEKEKEKEKEENLRGRKRRKKQPLLFHELIWNTFIIFVFVLLFLLCALFYHSFWRKTTIEYFLTIFFCLNFIILQPLSIFLIKLRHLGLCMGIWGSPFKLFPYLSSIFY